VVILAYDWRDRTSAVLDRITTETPPPAEPAPAAGRKAGALLRLRLRQFGRILSLRFGSSLVRRIVLLNMAGLVALLLGFLWLNQTRLGVIDARVQSLKVQAEIIAAALAGTALVDGNSITIDPERLLDLQLGESAPDEQNSILEFSLNPERIAPVLRRLVTPAGLRARVYDRDGTLLLDTRSFYLRGDIRRLDLPPPGSDATVFQRTWSLWKRRFGRTELTPLDESASGRPNQEVQRALAGGSIPVVRVNASGETIVAFTLPIQRLRSIQGALQLSTEDGDIDEVIAQERLNILVLFAVVTGVMAIVSLLMANTIAKPVERLAIAAERVRTSIKSRQQIPDFSSRSDEIGHLSGALRAMTDALYNRIAAIESFAADVAHELKNPLTSLRSAVETLPRVKTDEARGRLLEVIQHDVRRLDRLISDISDASRLDAELAKADAGPVDMEALLEAVVSMANDMRKKGEAQIALVVTRPSPAKGGLPGKKRDEFAPLMVLGHDSRLAQVFTNLFDNAKSFSPPGGVITVRLLRDKNHVIIKVEDTGPGIPDHARERIFERFYTDRPLEQGFGQNSGLGLSISRQIVEAHRGLISVANRPAPEGKESGGACFTVVLPAMNKSA
jgi:two-component system, OmpR family, sensor histidine kinase ChvG